MAQFSTKDYTSKTQNMNYYLTVPSFTTTFVFLKRYTFTDGVFDSVSKR